MAIRKTKKEIREQVAQTLDSSFGELKESNPKKFKRNVKKASKALVAGLKIKPVEKTPARKTKKVNAATEAS